MNVKCPVCEVALARDFDGDCPQCGSNLSVHAVLDLFKPNVPPSETAPMELAQVAVRNDSRWNAFMSLQAFGVLVLGLLVAALLWVGLLIRQDLQILSQSVARSVEQLGRLEATLGREGQREERASAETLSNLAVAVKSLSDLTLLQQNSPNLAPLPLTLNKSLEEGKTK